MSSRGRERDDDAPRRGPEDQADRPYPLLFKGSRPAERRTFVDRIVALFRTTSEVEEPTSLPLPVPKNLGPPPPSGVSSEAHSEFPRVAESGATAPAESPDSAESASEAPEGADPQPVALHRATLQMLPGRLQPMDWKVVPQEIRFLRPTNAEQGITLGWDRAEPPDHITIYHPSVRPRHARMRYRRGEWWIESLAEEDPVRVNDLPVPTEQARRLDTGDRLGLGEIEFRYMGT